MILAILYFTTTLISFAGIGLLFKVVIDQKTRYKLLESNLVDSMLRIGDLEKQNQLLLSGPSEKKEENKKVSIAKPKNVLTAENSYFDERSQAVVIPQATSKYLTLVNLLQNDIVKLGSDISKINNDAKVIRVGAKRSITDPRPKAKKAPVKRKAKTK